VIRLDRINRMRSLSFLLILFAAPAFSAEFGNEGELKFAFYSAAWGENTDDGLRLVVSNKSSKGVVLEEVKFLKTPETADDDIRLKVGLAVPAGRFAEAEFRYTDLLSDNECIQRTMDSNWRLVEVSNYTLNPSVRNLIIENTDSFRIYQCVETIRTRWRETSGDSRGVSRTEEGWILYHFETRQD
jgi:hypothetical protein